MTTIRQTIIYIFVIGLSSFISAQDITITDFGAKPDGKTLNTEIIQSVIDRVSSQGGGKVIVPEGRFLTGALVMKSGVDLHIADGGVLLGSTDPQHYFNLSRWKALLLAEGQNHLKISGKGVIDGQGRQLALHLDSLFFAGKIDSVHYNFVEMRPKYYLRPQLIEFVKCNHVSVRDVTLKNAACWVQTHDQVNHLVIDNVRTESDAYWNNDGIDISDCKNVRITNCYVNSADDGICLKSHSDDHICDSIYIADCTVRSSASAIKFGTKSLGGFTNVVIKNIKVYDTFRSAIAIESVDGGRVENILIDGVEATNTGNAIFIKLGNRRHHKATGTLRNIVIKNMRAEIAFERPDYAYEIRGPALPFFHNTFPSSITGIPGFDVENVVLENIEIVYPGRGNNGLAYMPVSRMEDVPEMVKAYPEFSMFGELPAWGFYLRHVRGLILKNLTIKALAPDYRPAIAGEDVEGLVLSDLNILGDRKEKTIVLKDSDHLQIENENQLLQIKN